MNSNNPAKEGPGGRIELLYGYARVRFQDEALIESLLLQTIAALPQPPSERQYDEMLAALQQQIRDHFRRKYATSATQSKARQNVRDILAVPFEPEITISSSHAELLERIDSHLFWRAARECLSLLHPVQADLYVLREMEDVSCREISKIMGLELADTLELVYRSRMVFVRCLLKQIDLT